MTATSQGLFERLSKRFTKKPSTSQSLFESLGAEVGIKKVVDEFYVRVTNDPELAPYFTETDMPALRRHQVAMLSAATGGPNLYTGRDVAEAHAHLNITEKHFDRVVEHLVDSLSHFDVDSNTIEQVGAVLAPLRPSIVSE